MGYQWKWHFRIRFERNFNAANFDSLSRVEKLVFYHEFLSQHHLYVNNMCTKFQVQEIPPKKEIQNLPTCVVVKKYSLLPTLTPSQGLKFFILPWNFWNSNFSMLITYAPNFKDKRSKWKIYIQGECTMEWTKDGGSPYPYNSLQG